MPAQFFRLQGLWSQGLGFAYEGFTCWSSCPGCRASLMRAEGGFLLAQVFRARLPYISAPGEVALKVMDVPDSVYNDCTLVEVPYALCPPKT